MCYNCGCHIPQDDMGHPDNITDQTLVKFAQSMNVSVEVLKPQLLSYLNNPAGTPPNQVFEAMFTKAAKAWGQPVEEAKKNTQELLNSQLKK